MSTETSQTEMKRRKKENNSIEYPRIVDSYQRCNMYGIGIPELKERNKGTEKIV